MIEFSLKNAHIKLQLKNSHIKYRVFANQDVIAWQKKYKLRCIFYNKHCVEC